MASDRIRLLIVEDVPEVAQYMRTALAAQGQITLVDVIADGVHALEAIPSLAPDVVVVDALLRGPTRPLQILALLHNEGIPGVVLTVPQTKVPLDPSRGIHAVVTMPFLGHDLVTAIQRAWSSRGSGSAAGSHRSGAPVIAVYGPKGGVGRTSLALSLAASAARAGRRVVLVDGCFQFGDLRTHLGVVGGPSILDLPTDRIEAEDVARVLQRGPSGVECLLAPREIEKAEMITARDVEKTLAVLREAAELVIVDLPPALSETTLAVLDAADAVALVASEEPVALANAATVAATFEALGYPAGKVRLVVGRVEGGMLASATTTAVAAMPVFDGIAAHVVPSEPLLHARAALERTAAVTLEPAGAFALAVGELLDALAPGARLVGAAPR